MEIYMWTIYTYTFVVYVYSLCNVMYWENVQGVPRSGQSKGSLKWIKVWYSKLIVLHGAIRSAIHIMAHFYAQTVIKEWMYSLHVDAKMTWSSQRTLYIKGWGSICGLQIIHTTFASWVILHGNVSQRRDKIQTILYICWRPESLGTLIL